MVTAEQISSEIITIGDELLLGRTLNGNAAFLGRTLATAGVPVKWATTVSDELSEIQAAIALALNRAHIVITSGGLGPTSDDMTRDAICGLFELKLEENPEQREHVEKLFRARGMDLPLQSRNQILIPSGATRLPNPIGTAAGIFMIRNSRLFFALPGVPPELEKMTHEHVILTIQKHFPKARLFNKTVRLAAIGESHLMAKLGDLSDLEKRVTFAYLPNFGMLDVRITAKSGDQLEAEADIAAAEAHIREKVGDHVYATGDETISRIIGDVLMNRSQKLASAESCTGGFVTDMLTNTPGASHWFERGWITYSNSAKSEDLGVDAELIKTHGAVSEEVVRAMAEGAREKAGAHWGISATGIAGPDGGSEDKPVGTIWIAVSNAEQTTTRKLSLGSPERERNKLRTANALLYMLYRRLMDSCE